MSSKIARLRKKYEAYSPMIYDKFSDREHGANMHAQMRADGLEYAAQEISDLRGGWSPLDGSKVTFVTSS